MSGSGILPFLNLLTRRLSNLLFQRFVLIFVSAISLRDETA